MKDTWFWDHIRQVHIDFHMPEFPRDAIKNFNAEAFVAQLVKAKVNVVGVFTKCHFGNAFYNTKVGHKHSGLEEDFFGEVLAEAHKYGIKVIAYYSLGTDEHAIKTNPDWCQIDEKGAMRLGNGTVWNQPCFNSPYREELVIPQIKELTENYDMDGYLLDIPYFQHHMCFCRYCRRKFLKEYGMELVPGILETHPELVREFGINSAARTMEEISRTIKRIKPHVLVNCNGAWKMGEPDRINATSDYGLWESQPASGTFLCHSFKSRYVRTLDVPVQIMTVRFTEGWGLMSCKTPDQLKYEFAAIMANGGIINVGDQVMTDGSLQSGVYDIIGEAFSFVEEREPYSIRSRSIPHIALIANYTDNWYWDKGDAATLGAAKMLIEGHQQFDIFLNDHFDNLDAYKIVILPETVKLSKAALDRLRAFVANGGLLIAEGKATLSRDGGNFLLSDVFGVDYLEYAPYKFAYMTENEALWQNNARIPQLLDGVFVKTTPADAEILSYIQWPYGESVPERTFRHIMPPPGAVSDFPAIVSNVFGQGRGIYIAAPIFQSYWDNNHFWLKNIVNNCINRYDAHKPYEIEASPAIEANMMEKEDKRCLHLIHFQNVHSGNRQDSLYEPIEKIMPVYDVKVKVKGDHYTRVVIQPEGTEIDFTVKDGITSFTVPKVHIHEIVELHTK